MWPRRANGDLSAQPSGTQEELPQRLALLAISVVLLGMGNFSEVALWRDATLESSLTQAQRITESFYAALFSGLGITLLLGAVLPKWPKWLPLGVLAATLLIMGLNYAASWAKVTTYGSDNAAALPYAALLLLQGKNPYSHFVLSDAVAYFGLPPEYVTTLTDGSPFEHFPYPAGGFVTVAPLIALGTTEVRPLYAAAMIVMVLLLYHKALPPYRLPFLALLFIHHLLNSSYIGGGLPESLWGLAVMGSWFLRGNVVAAGSLLGYAASVKQLGAFFLPFYAVHVLRTQGLTKAVTSVAAMASVFLAFNLPFFLGAPQAWLDGVVGLTIAPLPPLGMGPALFIHEAWPDVPYRVFTALGALTLVGAFLWYLLALRAPLYLAWVIPLLPLWFSWRSLSNYFYLLPLFAAAIFLTISREEQEHQNPLPGSTSQAPVAAEERAGT